MELVQWEEEGDTKRVIIGYKGIPVFDVNSLVNGEVVDFNSGWEHSENSRVNLDDVDSVSN